MNLFKLEDYRNASINISLPSGAAEMVLVSKARDISNLILSEHLATCPVVYGDQSKIVWRTITGYSEYQKAFLVDIQLLEEKKVTITEKEFDEAFSYAKERHVGADILKNDIKKSLGF